MSESANRRRGLHYKRRNCLNNATRRGRIIQLLKSGLSAEEVAEKLLLSHSYVRRIRWEAKIDPNIARRVVKREELENTYPCETLAPELHGQERKRYERLKAFHDFCHENNIIITPGLLREMLSYYHHQD